MADTPNIVDLRRMLADRFPAAHAPPRALARDAIATGVPALDDILNGGLAKGDVSELVGEGNGSGTAQVMHAILAQAAAEGRFVALVDGADSFDVDAPARQALSRLLWVRCRNVDQALKAADLLLRDRNLPLVLLDLKLNPPAELRKIASSVWHRFGRIAEHNGTSLLVITPWAMVGSVAVRVEARAGLGMEALSFTPGMMLEHLRFELLRAVDSAMRSHAGSGAA
jgi:hypothetical protein